MYKYSGNYGFQFLSHIANPPISLTAVGIEKRDSRKYYFDNKNREKSYLFQYTLSGSGTVVLGGTVYRLEAGQAFFLKMPGDEKYYFDEDNNNAPWHFIFIMFKGDAADRYYDFIKNKFGKILTLDKSSSCITALSEIFSLAHSGLINDSFTGERLAFDFLCKLCSSCLGDEAKHSDTVLEALKIIEREFSTLDGIFEISQRLGVTQNHLSRLFTAEMKTTPIAYLTKMRLQKAVNLLGTSRKSIEETARECGFSCGNYFCKVFSRHMGISPLKYRAQAKPVSFNNIKI